MQLSCTRWVLQFLEACIKVFKIWTPSYRYWHSQIQIGLYTVGCGSNGLMTLTLLFKVRRKAPLARNDFTWNFCCDQDLSGPNWVVGKGEQSIVLWDVRAANQIDDLKWMCNLICYCGAFLFVAITYEMNSLSTSSVIHILTYLCSIMCHARIESRCHTLLQSVRPVMQVTLLCCISILGCIGDPIWSN